MNYFESEEYGNTFNHNTEQTEFLECMFQGIDFSEKSFRSSKFIECKFKNCNLSNVALTNATLRDVEFLDCKIIGVNWSSINSLSDLTFKRSILNYSVFQDLNLQQILFEDCKINEVDFSQSNLTGCKFTDSDLNMTIFNNSNLSKADLTTATQYSIDPSFNKIKDAKFSTPEVLSLLRGLGIEVDGKKYD